MKYTWKEEWPKKEGYYWYYGFPYKINNFLYEDPKPSLHVINVRKIQNGFMVTRNGSLWDEIEKGPGLFKKIENPNLPDIKYLMEMVSKVKNL